ncbi:hypothetical protein PAXRUDRAFT_603973 [Paxillus rubicundulus Ve08.2h10]|uniref:Unplaced genomic scaffold scaffold_5053, whole genome shotgun sequence n=1 Tax=Paxillus rubicundulus Ve08.2h10 TaxID=930991 RepID=A0A0D0BP54_9AGAM|nr:hypothetical protein PAXRUDRAFT_603973 [Paxillus rubicundulus Ve08.2h10]
MQSMLGCCASMASVTNERGRGSKIEMNLKFRTFPVECLISPLHMTGGQYPHRHDDNGPRHSCKRRGHDFVFLHKLTERERLRPFKFKHNVRV